MIDASAFVHLEFWALVLCSVILPVGIYTGMVMKQRISRLTVLAFGILLIGLSAADLFLLRHLMAVAGTSSSLFDDVLFRSEFSAALYLLPLVSAAVGTNLISHVLVRHLKESESRFDRERGQAAERRHLSQGSGSAGRRH